MTLKNREVEKDFLCDVRNSQVKGDPIIRMGKKVEEATKNH